MKNIKATLSQLANAIAEEAARNADFATKLNHILGNEDNASTPKEARPKNERKGGRRAPAVLDPIDLARSDVEQLREALKNLDLSQLLDVVAEYGMDPGKLVMKWKDRERVIERIIETAIARATKGDAFRAQ